MPGESYRRRLRSLLLCLRDVFRERPLTQKQATLKSLLDNSGSVLLVDREDLELSHRRGHRVIPKRHNLALVLLYWILSKFLVARIVMLMLCGDLNACS